MSTSANASSSSTKLNFVSGSCGGNDVFRNGTGKFDGYKSMMWMTYVSIKLWTEYQHLGLNK